MLSAVLDELGGARAQVKLERAYCPDCAGALLSPVEANEHTSTCPRHPTILRLRAAEFALSIAPTVATDLCLSGSDLRVDIGKLSNAGGELTSAAHRSRYLDTDDTLKEQLHFFAGDGRRKYPSLLPQYAAALEVALIVWQRIFHRETDPCAHCGAVIALDDARKHALSCDQHPSVTRLIETTDQLSALLGADGARVLVEKVQERDRYVDQLRTLIQACDGFDHDIMGVCVNSRELAGNAKLLMDGLSEADGRDRDVAILEF